MFSFFRLVVCASLWLIIEAACGTNNCAVCFNTTTACALAGPQVEFSLPGGNDEENTKNICCQERQSLFYAVSRRGTIFHCYPCPPRVRTSSGRKEVNGSVSLGTASDVVVSLECGGAVDGITLGVKQPELPKWNSAAIGSTPGIRFLQNDTVEITPVYLANTITLECMIVLLAGQSASTEVKIVKSEGLFFTEAFQNVPLGSDLECPVPELPENDVTWHYAGNNEMLASNRAPSAGTYYCKVKQGNRGTYISGSVEVYQQSSPPDEQSVHNGSTNEILVAPGGDVPLNCNSPGAELLFNGEPRLIPNNRLTNVTSDDSGFYQCREGGTSPGNIITSTYVNVVNMHLSASYTSAQGCTLDLTCTLEHPVPEKSLKWFKNGIEISGGGRQSVNHNRSNGVSTTTLNVRDLNGDDGGEYKCEADIYTQYQTASPVSLTVDVVAPSGAPQNIQFETITSNTVAVTWEGPVNDGSVHITAYYIQWWKTDDGMATAMYLDVPVSSGEMSHTIRDLEVFTEYSVRIRASTEICNGIFSVVQTFTTAQEEPNNPPKDLTARPIHDSIVELQWKVPDEPHNGIISNYRITYHKTGASSEKSTVNSTSTTFEVGMLDADTKYTFYVQAGTSGGYGPPSPAVSVTTLSQVEPRGSPTPKVMKTLSYTVKVEFEELQISSGSFSHYWIVAVKLPDSRCSLEESDHPDNMFPREDNFSHPDNVLDSGAYVAAEIDAAKVNFPLEFVFGGNDHPDDDGNYSNVRLKQKSCYTFFLRGFIDIPPAIRATRDISMRRYRYYVTSQFMPPVTTLSETAWLQIRFSPVPSCAKWRDDDPDRRQETLERLANRINEVCNCGFNPSRFPDSFFSCDQPMEQSEESVVLKAEVNETNGFSAQDAVRAISNWKNESPSITVGGSSFEICSSCETAIESRSSEDCPPCSKSIDYTATIIGVSVGTGVILVVLAVIIIIVIVVIRCKSSKQKCDYDTNERNRPQEEDTHITPVVIANPPENNYTPVDFDGKYNDFRPQVVGGSATDLPTEFIPHAFLRPVHHSSTASLSSAGNGTPAPYAMMPIYPHPYGVRLPPVGMMPVKDIPVSHHQLANHRRTKSGDSIGMGNLGVTPSHSRQPSDVTVPAESRRLNEYVYYPYPYYHHYYPPHYYHSSGYASPSSHRMMVSERELEKRHLAGSGYSTPYLPQRPHTADLLEAEVPRGQSPMLYHKPQESVVSQPPMNGDQAVIHPFPRRGLKVQPGYFSTSHLPSKPIEGDHTMERFLTAQLQGSQQGLSDQHRDSNHEETPSSDSKSESKTNVSNLSLSNKLPGSSTNIESEVL